MSSQNQIQISGIEFKWMGLILRDHAGCETPCHCEIKSGHENSDVL